MSIPDILTSIGDIANHSCVGCKDRFGISKADAEDIYQESVTALAIRNGKVHGLDIDCEPSTFLYAVGRNQSLKFLRSRKSNLTNSLKAINSNALAEQPEVDAMFESEHNRALIREGLARLTERQREVLRLYYFEERSMQEVATIMGYNNADVAKKMKYEGLKKLSMLIVRSCVILFSFHVL
ncbi:MAG: sigma-70 family RNA polymerase sigma factor [Flavobacteriales bacterium]|nr:sigma-70 family RNA polymerase sigma factor [Flavobacteriales bacterium]